MPESHQLAGSPTVLITGCSRGIGLEFARQYAAKGWQVIASCRTPESASELTAAAANFPSMTIETLDVTQHQMIDALAEKYLDTPVDVLINNAGISGGYKHQVFGGIRYDHFSDVFATNFMAPLKMGRGLH